MTTPITPELAELLSYRQSLWMSERDLAHMAYSRARWRARARKAEAALAQERASEELSGDRSDVAFYRDHNNRLRLENETHRSELRSNGLKIAMLGDEIDKRKQDEVALAGRVAELEAELNTLLETHICVAYPPAGAPLAKAIDVNDIREVLVAEKALTEKNRKLVPWAGKPAEVSS